jgi:hypothetical protein
MNQRPILNVSTCCHSCSLSVKKAIRSKLSAYSKKLDLWNPYANITFDTLDEYKEKACQQTMLYDRVVVSEIAMPLNHVKDLYTSLFY